MSLQGQVPVDLGTFNGLREKWLQDTGKAPSKGQAKGLERNARNVRRGMAEENAVLKELGLKIEKETTGRKLPSHDEVRNRIAERMKDLPCRV